MFATIRYSVPVKWYPAHPYNIAGTVYCAFCNKNLRELPCLNKDLYLFIYPFVCPSTHLSILPFLSFILSSNSSIPLNPPFPSSNFFSHSSIPPILHIHPFISSPFSPHSYPPISLIHFTYSSILLIHPFLVFILSFTYSSHSPIPLIHLFHSSTYIPLIHPFL